MNFEVCALHLITAAKKKRQTLGVQHKMCGVLDVGCKNTLFIRKVMRTSLHDAIVSLQI